MTNKNDVVTAFVAELRETAASHEGGDGYISRLMQKAARLLTGRNAELAELRSVSDACSNSLADKCREVVQLKAELAALREQQPVAWAFLNDDGSVSDPSATHHSAGMIKLYAAPLVSDKAGAVADGLRMAAKWHMSQCDAFTKQMHADQEAYDATTGLQSTDPRRETALRKWENSSCNAANHRDYAAELERQAAALNLLAADAAQGGESQMSVSIRGAQRKVIDELQVEIERVTAELATQTARLEKAELVVESSRRVDREAFANGAAGVSVLALTGLGKILEHYDSVTSAEQKAQPVAADVVQVATDTERLDFLIDKEAFICWSVSGQCSVSPADPDAAGFPGQGHTTWYKTPRDAIDAALLATRQADGVKP